ncbi:MAG: Flp family type IVb pilin [Bacillota bacterium]|mgnify:FL=1|nr:Flp family type IVb pilin [Bacillota bacterium]HOA90900.1 Flp family type IVb pilin [Bacillota bacterium]HPQ11761.1 Flp family type IVb pilin [Bacillota bacterium]HPZ72743.1 Flp family type IVb pilin [Bacillota bacterium]HQD77735.1 Flp family type IVb pilin [Bacillota bacterium]
MTNGALLEKLVVDEKGQSLVEYGLLLLVIAAAVVVSARALGGRVNGIIQELVGQLSK